VLYSDDDARFLNGATNPTPGGTSANRAPRRSPISGEAATEFAEIGGAPKRQPVVAAHQFAPNIFPEREKTFGEAVNRYASTRAVEGKRGNWRPVASYVSEIERRLGKGELRPQDAASILKTLADRSLEQIEHAHIERVLSKIDEDESE
jgi:hypothetical protein